MNQLKIASTKWTTKDNVDQGLELQTELKDFIKALQPFDGDEATATFLASAQKVLASTEESLLQLRTKYYLQPTLEDVRKNMSILSVRFQLA